MEGETSQLARKISIVIVGVSGAGKTTLIESLRECFELTYLSYGQFVRTYGLERAAEEFHKAYEEAPTALVLMDEHLEYEHEDEDVYIQNLSEVYRSEHVLGVIYLRVDPVVLSKRHEHDRTSGKRHRDFIAESELEAQHELAKRRALKMQKLCGLKFLFVENSDELEKTIEQSKEFISEILQIEALKEYQKKLHPEVINFDLSTTWNTYWLMKALRKEVAIHTERLLEEALRTEDGILFDPQDLEHQSLFFLTTWNPSEITEEVIEQAVAEQYAVVSHKMESEMTHRERNYLFRGLTKFYPDLNVRTSDRLTLVWDGNDLFARGIGRNFQVIFKEITDQKIIELYTRTLHYIHYSRNGGRTFGLFFKGDQYPFAVQSIEPVDREYKKDALLYAGINPTKTIEVTRMYTLPGSPKNIASIMDGLVRRLIKEEGVEAMITTVMPAYAKTKGTTIAGGMSAPFLVKKLEHLFFKNKEGHWEHVINRRQDEFSGSEHKHSKETWGLPPVVEVVHIFGSKSSFAKILKNGSVVFKGESARCHNYNIDAMKS